MFKGFYYILLLILPTAQLYFPKISYDYTKFEVRSSKSLPENCVQLLSFNLRYNGNDDT